MVTTEATILGYSREWVAQFCCVSLATSMKGPMWQRQRAAGTYSTARIGALYLGSSRTGASLSGLRVAARANVLSEMSQGLDVAQGRIHYSV